MEYDAQKGAETSISDMVGKILQNPEFTGIINELRGGSGEVPAVSQSEIMSRLPDVMAMLKPLIGETSAPSASPKMEKSEAAEKKAELPPSEEPMHAVAAIHPKKKYDKARAEKLMAALKPYLNSNRCEIIDKCVSVIQITDIVEALQGLEGLTKPKP